MLHHNRLKVAEAAVAAVAAVVAAVAVGNAAATHTHNLKQLTAFRPRKVVAATEAEAEAEAEAVAVVAAAAVEVEEEVDDTEPSATYNIARLMNMFIFLLP